VFLAALGSGAASANASPSDSLRAAGAAFRLGDYARAVQLGRTAGSAKGSALAAWSELVEGNFLAPPSERLQEFKQAEGDARQALAFDGSEIEGHLALALALGFIGRMEGGVEAHLEGIADEARQHIDVALTLAPGDAWANALLGGWNLEIVNDGGTVGQLLYGATVEHGVAAYRRALQLDPSNSQIAYQFALDLLALGGDANRRSARGLLSDIVKRDGRDPIEGMVTVRAARFLAVLDARGEAQLATLLRDQLGGGR
jgi:hypothetical protein